MLGERGADGLRCRSRSRALSAPGWICSPGGEAVAPGRRRDREGLLARGGRGARRRDRVELEGSHGLERKQFVRRERRSSVAGENEYAFVHVLLRDVAYGKIPRAARARSIHGRRRGSSRWAGREITPRCSRTIT